MKARRWMICAAIALATLMAVTAASAHNGGRDSYGGHNDRKHGGYHFHAGPLAGQTFSSKDAALSALRAHEQRQAAPKAAPAPARAAAPAPAPVPVAADFAESDCDCAALVRLLIAKGVITEADYAAALAGNN